MSGIQRAEERKSREHSFVEHVEPRIDTRYNRYFAGSTLNHFSLVGIMKLFTEELN